MFYNILILCFEKPRQGVNNFPRLGSSKEGLPSKLVARLRADLPKHHAVPSPWTLGFPLLSRLSC